MINSPLLPHIAGYISGQWTPADSGETFPVTNPATGDKLADAPAMGAEETTRAIEAARDTLTQPAPLDQRRQWLGRIDALLRENAEEIGRIITLEQGKPRAEAKAEVQYAAGFFRYCADHADALRPHTLTERPRDCTWTIHHRPVGVAALITPWNFPIAMLAKKLSAALLADCPTLIKPATQTPLTMIALFTLLDEQVKLPPGKANLLLGPPKPIGDTLCNHPAVHIISFTGSTKVGKMLIEQTADHVKRLTLELGGNAPFIVFDDADLDAAADNLIKNKFRAAGQTCVCANRVYIHRNAADAFTQKFADRLSRLKIGNGMEEGVDLGPLIDRNGFEKVQRHVRDALDKGARRIVGDDPPMPDHDWGYFYPPTLLRNVTQNMACTQEETFGPVIPLIEFDDEQQIIQLANDTEYGLAAYLFTKDQPRAQRLLPALAFGHVGLNTGTGPTPQAPFGGMKQSGYGREGGTQGLFEFTSPQTVPEG